MIEAICAGIESGRLHLTGRNHNALSRVTRLYVGEVGTNTLIHTVEAFHDHPGANLEQALTDIKAIDAAILRRKERVIKELSALVRQQS